MNRYVLAATALAVVSVFYTRPAEAQFSVALGTRWAQTVHDFEPQIANAPQGDLDWNVALGFNEYISLMLGTSLGVVTHEANVSTNTGAMTLDDSLPDSATQFGFLLGGKFFLTDRRQGQISPYMYAEFYKKFAAVSDEFMTEDEVQLQAALYSPLGLRAAFGVEYNITSAFSIGADVIGLRWQNASGNAGNAGAGYNVIGMYTALTLNYRFILEGRVSVRREDRTEGQ